MPVAFCVAPAAGAAGLEAAAAGVFFAGVTDFPPLFAPGGAALPGAVFVGVDVSFLAGELIGFLVEGVGAAWIGFLDPMAERAGFAADPAVSFAAAEPAPAGGAFFAGGAALPGAVFVGVDLSFEAGALPGPVLLLIFLGAAFLGGSLSTILIFEIPSVDMCQLSVRKSFCVVFQRKVSSEFQSIGKVRAPLLSFTKMLESSFDTNFFSRELTIDQREELLSSTEATYLLIVLVVSSDLPFASKSNNSTAVAQVQSKA